MTKVDDVDFASTEVGEEKIATKVGLIPSPFALAAGLSSHLVFTFC